VSANENHDSYHRRKRKMKRTIVTQIYVLHVNLMTIISCATTVISALNVLGNLRFRLHLTIPLSLFG
jgi:hypothetical protein